MLPGGKRRGRPPIPLVEGVAWRADEESGCWIWLLRTLKGYGKVRNRQAHRVIWLQSGRLLADEDHLHHDKCRNTLCVNPEHMRPMSPSAHQRLHKRAISGFNDEEIIAIRSSTNSVVEIATAYDVSAWVIYDIRAGKNWLGAGPERPEVRCEHCGVLITSGRRHKRYCSPAHRQAAYETRRARTEIWRSR